MKDATDGELMKLVGQGNQKAFRELFSRYGSTVLGVSQRMMRDLSAAEDISQEVWVKVVRAAPAYKDEGKLRPWLVRITRNQALNAIRAKNSMTSSENSAGESLIDGIASPEDFEKELIGRHEVSRVRQLIDELPDQQRVALVIWLTDDCSYEDIGAELDLSVSSVKSLLFRARQTLLMGLKERL